MKETVPEFPKAMVGVVIGSTSDEAILKEAGFLEIIDECGMTYGLSVISAHRNPDELAEYCKKSLEGGTRIFVAAAGMAAALPGAIGANVKFSVPVIGVALPSAEFPDAIDSLLAITRMPGGCPVIFAGTGKAGLKNAALIAAQILAISEDVIGAGIKTRLLAWLKQNSKQPEILKKTNTKENGGDSQCH